MRGRLLLSFSVFVSLLIVHTSVLADVEEDGRFWLNINATGRLPDENWNWYAEVQPRWRHEGSSLEQLLIRPAFFYTLNKKTSIWVGYAHITTHPDGKSHSKKIGFGSSYYITLTR